MSNFDLILLALIAAGAVMGLFRGFLKEVVGTFGLLIAAIMANLASPYGMEYAGDLVGDGRGASMLVWVVTFILAMIVLGWVAHLLDKVLSSASLGWLNRLAGGVFGGLKFALICSLLIYLLQVACSFIKGLSIQEQIEQSTIVPLLNDIVSIVMPWVSEHILNPAVELLKNT